MILSIKQAPDANLSIDIHVGTRFEEFIGLWVFHMEKIDTK